MSEQSLSALAIANQRRTDASTIRKLVVAGQLTIAQALDDPRSAIMPIGRLLCCPRGMGPTKAHALLNHMRIWPTRRVDALTPRQKAEIGQRLSGPRRSG